MSELLLDLDFACCTCGATVGVKLKCHGKGLKGGAHAVVAVNVPCPTCNFVNQVCFEPCGTLRSVSPCRAAGGLPEPSLN